MPKFTPARVRYEFSLDEIKELLCHDIKVTSKNPSLKIEPVWGAGPTSVSVDAKDTLVGLAVSFEETDRTKPVTRGP